MSIQLTVISLDFETNEAPAITTYTKSELTIGRSQNNDVVLNSSTVSDKHAKLTLKETADGQRKLFITDLGSTNGTALGTRRLAPHAPAEVPLTERIVIADYLIKPAIAEDVRALSKEEEHPQEEPQRTPKPALIQPVKKDETRKKEEVTMSEFQHKSGKEISRISPMERLDSIAKVTSIDAGEASMDKEITRKDESKPNFNKPGDSTAASRSVHEPSVAAITGTVGSDNVISLDFEAVKLLSVKGRVMHKGKPLAGVTIDGGEFGSIKTGDSGEFLFEHVREGTQYEILASKKKFIIESNDSKGSLDQNATIEFSATELFNVSGVLMHRGKPLAGIKIDGGSLGETVTNSKGEYQFSDVPEGTKYSIRPIIDGFIVEQKKEELKKEEGEKKVVNV